MVLADGLAMARVVGWPYCRCMLLFGAFEIPLSFRGPPED
jgi:hypothetical protein